MKGERVQEWMVQQFWWKKKQRSADEWFDYFCMKSRECNNTPSQQNVCCSLSIPSFVFIYYYFMSREILVKGTKKPRMFVFIYVCGVYVCQYMCVLYIWVCGDIYVWHSWQGFCLPCCCIPGCRAYLHCCWHGIRGGLMTFLTWVGCALQHTYCLSTLLILAPSEFGRVLWNDVIGFSTLWRWA